MPRLFTGLQIPGDIAKQLHLLQFGILGAKWIEPADFHITLRFFGDVDECVADDIADGLQDISPPSFKLQLSSTGVFGGDKPRMLWSGVKSSPSLDALHLAHEAMAQRIGLVAEGRKFIPHVTIARMNPRDRVLVDNFLIDHGRFSSVEFEVKSFTLYSAKSSTGGGPYIVEQTYDLDSYL